MSVEYKYILNRSIRPVDEILQGVISLCLRGQGNNRNEGIRYTPKSSELKTHQAHSRVIKETTFYGCVYYFAGDTVSVL